METKQGRKKRVKVGKVGERFGGRRNGILENGKRVWGRDRYLKEGRQDWEREG